MLERAAYSCGLLTIYSQVCSVPNWPFPGVKLWGMGWNEVAIKPGVLATLPSLPWPGEGEKLALGGNSFPGYQVPPNLFLYGFCYMPPSGLSQQVISLAVGLTLPC